MSRQTIIDKAAEEDGTRESPAGSNKTKYGKWYGLDGVKWCAIFVSYIYHHAGHPLEAIDRPNGYQSCQSGFNFWKRNNRIIAEPRPGDIVLFDWTGSGIANHTGIFLKWINAAKTRFQSWEGNTAVGDDSDGGQVMLRERNKVSVKAFVTPLALNDGHMTDASSGTGLRIGDAGADILQLQKLLVRTGAAAVVVNGDFDQPTHDALIAFQRKNGLPETGILTPEVYGALEEEADVADVSPRKFTSGSYLRRGDSGGPVLLIQRELNGRGARPPITENGIFDMAMLRAVKAFQSSHRLQVDGIVGPKTLAALGLR